MWRRLKDKRAHVSLSVPMDKISKIQIDEPESCPWEREWEFVREWHLDSALILGYNFTILIK